MIITSSHGNVNMILKFVGIIYTLRTVWEKCKDRKLWRWRLRFISDIIHNRKYTTDDYWKNINRRRNNSYGIKSRKSSRKKNVWLQLCAGSGMYILRSGGNWRGDSEEPYPGLRSRCWWLSVSYLWSYHRCSQYPGTDQQESAADNAGLPEDHQPFQGTERDSDL